MSHGFYHLQYILPIYFGFAVFYDVFTTIYDITYHGAPLPWEPTLNNGIVVPNQHYPDGSLYANDTFTWLEGTTEMYSSGTNSWTTVAS